MTFENKRMEKQSVRSKRLQIVLMATGAFAVPSMRLLCEDDSHDIVCLITNPLRHDRHGNAVITPARQFAAEYNIPVSEITNVHSREFFDFLYLVHPDLLFVCDFGHILPKRALEGSRLGGINLHGSLLPKYRGAAPVVWAILNGELYTGVSIIHITPEIDAGPVIAQSPPIPIGAREKVLELEERLADYGAELVRDVIEQMAGSHPVKIIEQLHKNASKAPKLHKDSGQIPWNKTAAEIYNHFRAMDFWPRSFTTWQRNGQSSDSTMTMRLILGDIVPLTNDLEEATADDFLDGTFVEPMLLDAKMNNLADLLSAKKERSESKRHQIYVPKSIPARLPGTVIRAEGGELLIAARDGVIKILSVQPAGKKMMPVKEFLRGYHVKSGDRFS